MAPVLGEPILLRTVRLLTAAGIVDIRICTWDRRIRAAGCSDLYVAPTAALTGSLGQVMGLWGDGVVVLLGDVVWTDEALNSVLSCREDLMFFGRRGASLMTGRGAELFGVRAAGAGVGELKRRVALADARVSLPGDGKLWHVLLADSCAALHELNDLTDDIDCFGEETDWTQRYLRWQRRTPMARRAILALRDLFEPRLRMGIVRNRRPSRAAFRLLELLLAYGLIGGSRRFAAALRKGLGQPDYDRRNDPDRILLVDPENRALR